MSTQRPAQAHRIAIVGSGPRALSVVERVAALLAQANTITSHVHLYLIDSHQIGSGRVWRTAQPHWFLMNIVADQVSAFSGPSDGGPPRPGAGPSLGLWWRDHGPDYPGPNSYAPRALHGHYMQFVMSTVEAALHGRAHLHKVCDTVVDLDERPQDSAGRFLLTLASGTTIAADRVVLVPGHSMPAPRDKDKLYADFAIAHPELHHIRGDSAADMALDKIAPRASVGIVGLGLSFYDVMAALTIGRGGRFVEAAGELRYEPSGQEPQIIAGSRSGMLVLARGRNQKHANFRYEPAIFSMARARSIRARGPVDFAKDIVPLLLAEVNLVYYQTLIRQKQGEGAAATYRQLAVERTLEDVESLRLLARQHGVHDVEPIDLDRIAHPFRGKRFGSPAGYHAALLAEVAADLVHAELGNVDSPVKAALDVIRDTRAIIRSLVDFGGLTPGSHRGIFLEWYVPRSSFLAGAAPRFRLHQAAALIKSGVLRIAGPDVTIDCDASTGRYVLSSPSVEGSAVQVSALIDARIPTTDIALDISPLALALRRKGFWTSFVNHNSGDAFDTGGVAVTNSPYHPLGFKGQPHRNLYVLGIPTEHTRWFMRVGSSRPGFWTDFAIDADAVARDALAPVFAIQPDEQLAQEAAPENSTAG